MFGETMFCINCGGQNLAEASFCASCGSPTNKAQQTYSPPMQAPPVMPMQMTPAMQGYGAQLAPRPMDLVQAVKSSFRKFADFKGRASRSEYWYFALATNVGPYLLVIAGSFFSALLGGSDLAYAISNLIGLVAAAALLASIIPSLACATRRLHDTGHSGGAIFLSLIPIVGPIILIVWLASAGEPVDNKYGPASI